MDTNQEMKNVLNTDDQQTGLPGMINVLTILSIIASILAIVSSFWSYFTVCKSVEKLADQEMPEVGGFLGKFLNDSIDTMVKQCDSRLVILVATLATSLLCLFGAMMMRKLKKQGFMIYVLGELIGPLSMMVILGSSIMMVLGMIIPVIFVILYATQRKYLVN